MYQNNQTSISFSQLSSSLVFRFFGAILFIALISLSSCILPPEEVIDDILEERFTGEFQGTGQLDEVFGSNILRSALFQAYLKAISEQEMEFRMEAAHEVFFKGMPEAAQSTRSFIIPVRNYANDSTATFLYYTYDTLSLAEQVFLVESLPQNQGYRYFTNPDLQAGFEWRLAPGGALMTVANFGNAGSFVECVLQRLVLWGFMNPALLNTCLTLCQAGGIYNPGCQACLAGAVVYLTAAAWVCS